MLVFALKAKVREKSHLVPRQTIDDLLLDLVDGAPFDFAISCLAVENDRNPDTFLSRGVLLTVPIDLDDTRLLRKLQLV